MHRLRLILIFLVAGLSIGCVSRHSADPGGVSDVTKAASGKIDSTRLIAMDFVNALQQLESLQPASTTVHFLRASRSDAFTMDMKHALQAAGYAFRWVGDASSGWLFQYRQELETAALSGQLVTYEIAVGSVELRRSYFLDKPVGVNPITPLYVRGADGSGIVMDDALFMDNARLAASVGRRSDELAESPEPVAPLQELNATTITGSPRQELNATAIDGSPRQELNATAIAGSPRQELNATTIVGSPRQELNATTITGSPLSVPKEANPLNPQVSGTNRQRSLTLPLADMTRVENVFELGQSNFRDMLINHRVVRKLTLMFPNDSLRLGEVNKRLVAQMVRSYRPGSDLFSVVGCSLGPTQLKSGNAALALGRASRVREALQFAGIPQDRILDEGCWAGDSSDSTLPRRGVVVTLNRQV